MARTDANLEAKRKQAVAKIKEIAPHAEVLIGMLDETKIDLLLISLAGATIVAA
ncbi:hypothetical protein [Mesorhizobium sp. M7A.F.Ca.MR.362.00.0.0]|uniref:hypothetical protein n=1 Tax=Mesorhizobium sp. M7A.F.Ca.MR.362.00.0.0 TaxID=2496779 RepID=UPI0013E33C56|nr:hypothetical protein [Mesorhizobium sp. M7A.F.Ca.MR.362.00.0.0]